MRQVDKQWNKKFTYKLKVVLVGERLEDGSNLVMIYSVRSKFVAHRFMLRGFAATRGL